MGFKAIDEFNTLNSKCYLSFLRNNWLYRDFSYMYLKEYREVSLHVQLLRLKSEASDSLDRIINCTNHLIISL